MIMHTGGRRQPTMRINTFTKTPPVYEDYCVVTTIILRWPMPKRSGRAWQKHDAQDYAGDLSRMRKRIQKLLLNANVKLRE